MSILEIDAREQIAVLTANQQRAGFGPQCLLDSTPPVFMNRNNLLCDGHNFNHSPPQTWVVVKCPQQSWRHASCSESKPLRAGCSQSMARQAKQFQPTKSWATCIVAPCLPHSIITQYGSGTTQTEAHDGHTPVSCQLSPERWSHLSTE